MLDLLRPYKYVLDAVLIATLVGAFAYGVHRYNAYQQGLGEARVQAQWDKATAAALQAQRLREIQFQKEKDDAVAQANKNAQAANAAAAAAAHSSSLLNATLQAVVTRANTDSVDANRRYVASLTAVFQEFTDQYRQLGQEADRLYNDKQALIQAWPK